jgi:hypothetical protein
VHPDESVVRRDMLLLLILSRGMKGYRFLMRNLEYGYLFEQRSANLPITAGI